MDLNQINDLKLSLATDARIERSKRFTEDVAKSYLELDDATKAKFPNPVKAQISSLSEFLIGVNKLIQLPVEELQKPVPDTEKESSINKAQEIAFNMTKSIYQAHMLVKAGDEESELGILKPIVDAVNDFKDYADEQLLPLFGEGQVLNLRSSEELAFSFDVDRIDDGEGIKYLVRKASEKN